MRPRPVAARQDRHQRSRSKAYDRHVAALASRATSSRMKRDTTGTAWPAGNSTIQGSTGSCVARTIPSRPTVGLTPSVALPDDVDARSGQVTLRSLARHGLRTADPRWSTRTTEDSALDVATRHVPSSGSAVNELRRRGAEDDAAHPGRRQPPQLLRRCRGRRASPRPPLPDRRAAAVRYPQRAHGALCAVPHDVTEWQLPPTGTTSCWPPSRPRWPNEADLGDAATATCPMRSRGSRIAGKPALTSRCASFADAAISTDASYSRSRRMMFSTALAM